MDEIKENSRWFCENLLPHESALRSWLKNRFPSGVDIDDVLQDAYLRVMKARERVEVENPKAFLYATARNIALDCLRRPYVAKRDCMEHGEFVELVDDGVGVPETVARNQELEILTKAVQSLPKRCRRAFTLAKIYGMSHKGIARELGVSERTVANHLALGVRKCSEFFEAYSKPRKKGA